MLTKEPTFQQVAGTGQCLEFFCHKLVVRKPMFFPVLQKQNMRPLCHQSSGVDNNRNQLINQQRKIRLQLMSEIYFFLSNLILQHHKGAAKTTPLSSQSRSDQVFKILFFKSKWKKNLWVKHGNCIVYLLISKSACI